MIALKILLLSFIAAKVDGHGYSKSPRSRNFVANQDGKWSGGTVNDPQIETCHHCLNRESGGGCGVSGSHDYNDPRNAKGSPMPVNIQETFVRGQEFDFEAVLTAHHKGHFEYKACPIQPGGKGSQECFDNHKLEFVEDLLYDAPKDPSYPERAYIPLAEDTSKEGSNYIYKHRYKLPDNLVGELVLIQWHYVTANSCLPKGYDTYNWPTDWYPGSLGTCKDPLPADGNGSPEQFWNCAEVKITSGGSSPVAPPISTPMAAPTLSPIQSTPAPVLPTPAPVLPTSAPVSSPVQPGACPADFTGFIPTSGCKGYLVCQNGSLTSEYDCGEGKLFDANMRACNLEQFVTCESNPTDSPVSSPTVAPVSPPTNAPVTPPTNAPVTPPTNTAPVKPPTTASIIPSQSPVQVVKCPSDYTGLIKNNGCTAFYHCYYGELVSEVPIECPDGLLYNSDGLCMCNFVFVL